MHHTTIQRYNTQVQSEDSKKADAMLRNKVVNDVPEDFGMATEPWYVGKTPYDKAASALRNEGLVGDFVIAQDGGGYALAYKKADFTMGKLPITRLGGVYQAGTLGVQPNLAAIAAAFPDAVRKQPNPRVSTCCFYLFLSFFLLFSFFSFLVWVERGGTLACPHPQQVFALDHIPADNMLRLLVHCWRVFQ